jgi:hypothetical protein
MLYLIYWHRSKFMCEPVFDVVAVIKRVLIADLLYWACKKLNSSLILSIDSPMVSLKGEGCGA